MFDLSLISKTKSVSTDDASASLKKPLTGKSTSFFKDSLLAFRRSSGIGQKQQKPKQLENHENQEHRPHSGHVNSEAHTEPLAAASVALASAETTITTPPPPNEISATIDSACIPPHHTALQPKQPLPPIQSRLDAVSLKLHGPLRHMAIDAIVEVPSPQSPGSATDIAACLSDAKASISSPLNESSQHPPVTGPEKPHTSMAITSSDHQKQRKAPTFYLKKRTAISISNIANFSTLSDATTPSQSDDSHQIVSSTNPGSTTLSSASTIALQTGTNALSIESCSSGATTGIHASLSIGGVYPSSTMSNGIDQDDDDDDFVDEIVEAQQVSGKYARKGSLGAIKIGAFGASGGNGFGSHGRSASSRGLSRIASGAPTPIHTSLSHHGIKSSENTGDANPSCQPGDGQLDLNASMTEGTLAASNASSVSVMSPMSTSSSQSSLSFSYWAQGRMRSAMSNASMHAHTAHGGSHGGANGTVGNKTLRSRAESSSQTMKAAKSNALPHSTTSDSIDSIMVLEAAMAENARRMPAAVVQQTSGVKTASVGHGTASTTSMAISSSAAATTAPSKSNLVKSSVKRPPASGAMIATESMGNHQRYASACDFQNGTSDIKRVTNIDDLYVVRKVASGGFADVFLVRSKISSGRYYALKAVKKSEVIKAKLQRQIIYEKQILESIQHNFIVELYHTFQSRGHLFFIMEYIAGGDLYSMMKRLRKFTDTQARFYAAEIICVFGYLHRIGVIYRDLKPENILLDPTGHIKLADFGFAKRVSTTTSSFCGTPDYIAPEVIQEKKYSKGVDWWSVGVLIFELVCGKTPFRAHNVRDIYCNVLSGKIQWKEEHWGHIKSLIQSLLQTDPEKRLGSVYDMVELQTHPWFDSIDWNVVSSRGLMPPIQPHWLPPNAIERHAPRQDEVLDELMMEESVVMGQQAVMFETF